jgi:hypothetical protein
MGPETADEICRCGHPFSPHILVPYDNDPLGGGLMFCQLLDDCECASTWNVPQAMPVRSVMPPPHVVAEYRDALRERLRG